MTNKNTTPTIPIVSNDSVVKESNKVTVTKIKIYIPTNINNSSAFTSLKNESRLYEENRMKKK